MNLSLKTAFARLVLAAGLAAAAAIASAQTTCPQGYYLCGTNLCCPG